MANTKKSTETKVGKEDPIEAFRPEGTKFTVGIIGNNIKTDTLKKAGSVFDQIRVSTKYPQEGNIGKLST